MSRMDYVYWQEASDDLNSLAYDDRMVVCETCGGDGSFDRVVGHDPSGPVWEDLYCSTCQGAGEYAVKTKTAGIEHTDHTEQKA